MKGLIRAFVYRERVCLPPPPESPLEFVSACRERRGEENCARPGPALPCPTPPHPGAQEDRLPPASSVALAQRCLCKDRLPSLAGRKEGRKATLWTRTPLAAFSPDLPKRTIMLTQRSALFQSCLRDLWLLQELPRRPSGGVASWISAPGGPDPSAPQGEPPSKCGWMPIPTSFSAAVDLVPQGGQDLPPSPLQPPPPSS